MTYSILRILFSPDLLDFLSFLFLSFYLFLFWRILVRSCLLVAKIRYPPLSRYDPTDVPGKISLAPSASFLFSYFLFSIFLISAALTSLRSLSSEISGENSRESKKLPSKYGTPFNAHFSRDFPPGSGAINHRRTNRCSDRVYRANVRGTARESVARGDFSRTLFFGRDGGHLPQNRKVRRKGE